MMRKILATVPLLLSMVYAKKVSMSGDIDVYGGTGTRNQAVVGDANVQVNQGDTITVTATIPSGNYYFMVYYLMGTSHTAFVNACGNGAHNSYDWKNSTCNTYMNALTITDTYTTAATATVSSGNSGTTSLSVTGTAANADTQVNGGTTGLYVIIENKSGGDCTLDNIVVSVGGTPITNSVGSSNDRELTKSTLTFHAAVLEVTEDPVDDAVVTFDGTNVPVYQSSGGDKVYTEVYFMNEEDMAAKEVGCTLLQRSQVTSYLPSSQTNKCSAMTFSYTISDNVLTVNAEVSTMANDAAYADEIQSDPISGVLKDVSSKSSFQYAASPNGAKGLWMVIPNQKLDPTTYMTISDLAVDFEPTPFLKQGPIAGIVIACLVATALFMVAGYCCGIKAGVRKAQKGLQNVNGRAVGMV